MGNKYRANIYKNVREHRTNSSLRWPIQMIDCISTFSIWRATIKRISKCSKNGTLMPPIGKWITNPETQMILESVITVNKQYLLKGQDGNL
jgi:hypothetical protein